MRLSLCLVVFLAACGGGDPAPEVTDISQPTQEDYDWADQRCEPHGGLRRIMRTVYSIGRNGSVIDAGFVCRCSNGTIVATPMRHE